MPPLASPCTSSPSTIPGSLEWGRSVVLAGDISCSRAKYRPLHAACREIPNRNAHPLPATLLSGMAVAHLQRQSFWCLREARGTLPGSRARVVRPPMLSDHRADDPWSIDETADATRRTMPETLLSRLWKPGGMRNMDVDTSWSEILAALAVMGLVIFLLLQ
jgi:hypothetical protein